MAATCAVCLTPIVPPQKFVISGTEVLHPGCARSGQATILARTRLALAAAEESSATNVRRVADMTIRLSDMERRAQQRTADEFTLRRRHREEIQGLERARDAAITERDAARHEAALHQTIAARSPTGSPSTSSTPTPAESDTRDPTEVRMGLLELDPL